MLQLLNNWALICIYGSLTVFAVGCQGNKDILANTEKQKLSPNSPTAKESSNFIDKSIISLETTIKPHSISKPVKTPKPQKAPLFFEMGLDKANGALSISQSAKSIEDWKLVASLYRDAIALMREVRRDSSEYSSAQIKIKEYQQQIKYSQGKAIPRTVTKIKSEPKKIVRSIPPLPSYPQKSLSIPAVTSQRFDASYKDSSQGVTKPTTSPKTKPTTSPEISSVKEIYLAPINQDKESEVFVVPIKRRIGGTPIIEVIFNGQRTFDMIVDTGASGTVITQKMAKSLNVVAVGKAQANTASAKSVEFPIGYVNSIEVSGAKANKVAVAIAGAGLEVGLLGHDFFGDFDLTIKRDIVEFRPQKQENYSPTQKSESAMEKQKGNKGMRE